MHVQPGGNADDSPGRPKEWAPIDLIGCGHAYPSDVVDNDMYFARCRFPIADDRTALVRESRMQQRYYCREDENTYTLGRDAARMAIESSRVAPEEIDVLIVSSCTTLPGFNYPNPADPVVADLSTLILKDLGRDGALGFDLKATYCAGFPRALQLMDALLQNPNYGTGLIVASDVGGRFASAESNRSAFCFVVGDSAGAVLLKKGAPPRPSGILDYDGAMYPSQMDLTRLGADGRSLVVRSKAGEAALGHMLEIGRRLLARHRLRPTDVDWLLPMQGYAPAIDVLVQELRWPPERVLWFGDRTGYAASASIPTCLSAQVQAGNIRKGDLILSLAAGAGFNSGGALYRFSG
jgi:3-oxoacyl-[acyl-carrier-protein] synthase III